MKRPLNIFWFDPQISPRQSLSKAEAFVEFIQRAEELHTRPLMELVDLVVLNLEDSPASYSLLDSLILTYKKITPPKPTILVIVDPCTPEKIKKFHAHGVKAVIPGPFSVKNLLETIHTSDFFIAGKSSKLDS